MHYLNLRDSAGREIGVPVRLPQSITFDCFIPGLGIMCACLHPTSLDPAQADVGDAEVWRPELGFGRRIIEDLTPLQDDALVEQAGDVLAYVVDRLMVDTVKAQLLMPEEPEHSRIIRRIADMASAEARAWEAWSALPENVRRGSMKPRDPSGHDATPSSVALANYVDVLVEQAAQMTEKAAKEREADWIHEQNEENAAMRSASRTDAAIDAAKELHNV